MTARQPASQPASRRAHARPSGPGLGPGQASRHSRLPKTAPFLDPAPFQTGAARCNPARLLRSRRFPCAGSKGWPALGLRALGRG